MRLSLEPAAATTQGQVRTEPTFLGQTRCFGIIIPFSEGAEEVAAPDALPRITQDVSGGDVIGLAG